MEKLPKSCRRNAISEKLYHGKAALTGWVSENAAIVKVCKYIT